MPRLVLRPLLALVGAYHLALGAVLLVAVAARDPAPAGHRVEAS